MVAQRATCLVASAAGRPGLASPGTTSAATSGRTSASELQPVEPTSAFPVGGVNVGHIPVWRLRTRPRRRARPRLMPYDPFKDVFEVVEYQEECAVARHPRERFLEAP